MAVFFYFDVIRNLSKTLAADTFVHRKQDAGIKQDCINTVKSAIEQLGGLDIIISNAVGVISRLKKWKES
jgi:hypothetical protein